MTGGAVHWHVLLKNAWAPCACILAVTRSSFWLRLGPVLAGAFTERGLGGSPNSKANLFIPGGLARPRFGRRPCLRGHLLSFFTHLPPHTTTLVPPPTPPR